MIIKAALFGALSILTLASLAAARPAEARAQGETHCLAAAIYFEARGESVRGQKAVAEVIMTRAQTAGRPKTICGVVYEGAGHRTGCQFSFACDRHSDVAREGPAWTRAKHIAAEIMQARGKGNQITRGATYFHAARMKPRWASHMVRVAQIGSQVFYRP